MYERTTPVCDGEIVNRVPTVRIATTKVRTVPKKSSRMPSHLYVNLSVDMQLYARMAVRT